MPSSSFLARRLLQMIPTFFGITLLTFCVMQWAPGDPMALATPGVVGRGPDAEALRARREAEGLDRPLPVQYLVWVGKVATLDFGTSYQDGQPVLQKIARALPRTLLLSLLALFFSYLVAVPLGVHAAARQDALSERLTTLGLFLLYSLPPFWVAIMLLLALGTDRGISLFPLQGLTRPGFEALGPLDQFKDLVWHLVLPVTVLTYGSLALLSRYMHGAMLGVLRQDFIRTARAKGLAERAVIFRHALKNSLLPLLTLLGMMLPALLGGSVIVEQIFGIPGMGLLALEAILSRDYPVVMGITTLVALLTLMGTLLSDLAYAWADPRVDLEGTG